jgi:quinol monooxygenase YgiN
MSATQLISIAKATAKPDCVERLEQELRARVAPTRAQPGNIEFSLHRSVDDPYAIVALERWESRADWERHLEGPHVTSLMVVFAETLAGPPEIQLLTPLEVGPEG